MDTFELKINNNIDKDKVKEDSFKDIIEDFQLTAQLLDITKISVGESFEGIVFAKQVISNKNKSNELKYDITMELIDKNGYVFYATLFSFDKKLDFINTPILINKGIFRQAMHGRLYYNIYSFDIYKESQFPISLFLKKIEGYNEEKVKFNNYIESIGFEKYKDLINSLKLFGYIDRIEQDRFKLSKGIKIGSTMKLFNNIIDLFKMTKYIDNEDIKTKEEVIIDTLVYLLIQRYNSLLNTIPEYSFKTKLYLDSKKELDELYNIYGLHRGVNEAVELYNKKIIKNTINLLEDIEETKNEKFIN